MALTMEASFQHFRETLGEGADRSYFDEHEVRYRRIVSRVTNHINATKAGAPACRILDIGAHFLHVSSVLSLMGFAVSGIDVALFTGQNFVQSRAANHQIDLATENDLSAGRFLHDQLGAFDIVLFTEAIEHITFNPVAFWHRVSELLTPNGVIYLATPNATRLMHRIATIKRALLASCIGLDVRSIVLEATYSHHWKEYTVREIRQYFALMFDQPQVQLATYRYRPINAPNSIKDAARWLARRIGECLRSTREEIDGFVSLPNRQAKLLAPADLHGATQR
jgi:2-polyprenyl-3-methyl-5-hydroxy-6-metoxy-1,4-benzoquinol methylase